MTDRGFDEVDLRGMLETASAYRDGHEEGRFAVETSHHGRVWAVLVEADPLNRTLVEITSTGDLLRDTVLFYARTDTLELLLIDRETWTLELHRLDPMTRSLTLTVGSTASDSQTLTSETTGLIFRLLTGPERPRIEVTDPASGGCWLI